MSRRFATLLLRCGILLAAGLAYAFFCIRTGWMLPCPVHAATGFQCPGCGVSHMCLALLRLDLAAAWGYNPGLMACLPMLLFLGARCGLRYVQSGNGRLLKREAYLCWGMVVWLLVWMAVRNLLSQNFFCFW